MRQLLKKSQAPTTINSIVRAADVLINLNDGVNRITDISNRINLGYSTTYRLLKTLEATGLVVQDTVSRKYYLGPLIVKLASDHSMAHQHLLICALNEMKRLWELNGETVALHILTGMQRVCLKELQSSHGLRFVLGEDAIGPLYPGVMGKALLAQCADEELKVIIEKMTIVAMTPKTILDKNLLREELKKVREQGYATSCSEREEGALGISVPIKNYVLPVALSIVAPESRLRPKMLVSIEELKKSANRISQKLQGNTG